MDTDWNLVTKIAMRRITSGLQKSKQFGLRPRYSELEYKMFGPKTIQGNPYAMSSKESIARLAKKVMKKKK